MNVTEELLDLKSLKGQTRGTDLLVSVCEAVDDMKLPWSKVSGIITDGAPAGERSGLSTLICNKVSEEAATMEGQEVEKWQKQDYTTDFNPRLYLDMYYSTPPDDLAEGDTLPHVLQFLHSTFSKGGLSGQRLLDIGSGPTIYQVLSACERFSEIYLSEFVKGNREELQSWLNRSPGAFDWTSIIQFVCRLEGHSRSWNQGPFDCILSILCLEVACVSTDQFVAALGRMCNLLRPGGWLVLGTDLGETFYYVGSKRFHVLTVDQACVLHAVEAAGLTVQHMETYVLPEPPPGVYFDLKAMVFLRAQKM
ncbi:nicotinamide N-methyltransferase-like isoform X3 [Lethenteron reissneri]|uniref:nicotinamide N-methyltransferase-like isoform X3 n=1 Tax=Lethenteron reissneri TaxID=7753 RepID=UPI002AB78312|nr:nicotinamide N-methyltransferase-like isoform X3 [Lethenteron reissneri]